MKVTVVPASTKTSQAAIEHLLSSTSPDVAVVGIYRDLNKVPEKFKANPAFEARQGDIATVKTLDFTRSNAVITVSPPLAFNPGDPIDGAKRLAENVADSVRCSGTVQRLVYVSSMGAQYETGTGEIATNHVAEKALAGAAPEVVFVRCAYFMENWGMALHGLKGDPPSICTTISPASHAIPMVSVNDIGAYCASQALSSEIKPSDKPHVTELQGPQDYSSLDVKQALEEVTGKKIELRVVEPDSVASFFGALFPPHVVPLYVEMNTTLLPGSPLLNDPANDTPVHRGSDTLATAIHRMMQ
ncbi:hypothetical protein F5883DRAFT_469264 [Diaporthe sp. PMI_573]|nr:hypothetical protein F5883DRAFT_469264 [Diaporthaceae sp. PMI_573]